MELVTRNSYKNDIVFKIIDKKNNIAYLEGVYERIKADSPLEDLNEVSNEILDTNNKKKENYLEISKKIKMEKKGYITGKILHIDGDETYLNDSLDFYKKMGVYAVGIHLKETEISKNIIYLIETYNPDIIVITGHDSYNKNGIKDLNNYKNSSNFINAIKEIRKKYSKDDKVVVAGACQSHFEALIASGANLATSPKRVNVHLYDPAIAAIKISFTPFNKVVRLEDIYRFSYIKKDGLGGIEFFGKMRLLYC